jgi:perosamine synthetase
MLTRAITPLPAAPAPAPAARPRAPIAPVLSRASFGERGRPALPAVTAAGAVRLVTSGRIAIGLALRQMRLGPGDALLAPAWHSLSMIEPLRAHGVTPVFYRIGLDAAPDLADVAAKLTPAIKAIMVPHYFGFPQDLAPLRALCDERGLMLLEDCAHCFFGERDGHAVGSLGDYAIASSMKFFPIYEGGCLVSRRHRLDAIVLRSAGPGFEAKAALAALENSFAYGRLPLLRALLRLPLALKDAAWRRLKARRAPGSAPPALTPDSSDSSFRFDPAWLDKRSALFSRAMLRLVSQRRIVTRRRANYLRLERTLAGLPGCRPLFAQLAAGACPWQLPLLLERPQPVFEHLVRARVPVVRFGETLWPGVDASVCANSALLSQRVLAIPCHQELRDEELDWMAARIREALLG